MSLVSCSNPFATRWWIKYRDNPWSARSNWKWLPTFSLQPNTSCLSKFQCGGQMDVRQCSGELMIERHTCSPGSEILFHPNSRPLRTCRAKKRKWTCWPKRKPSYRCKLKMWGRVLYFYHIPCCMQYDVFFNFYLKCSVQLISSNSTKNLQEVLSNMKQACVRDRPLFLGNSLWVTSTILMVIFQYYWALLNLQHYVVRTKSTLTVYFSNQKLTERLIFLTWLLLSNISYPT